MTEAPARSAADACRIWILTDGKIGDDVQCLAVARALAPEVEKRVITPRPAWRRLGEWTAPWGPVDPRDGPEKTGSPIAPPFPDVLIASGRRAIPYARAVRRASGGKTFVAIMKDPRIAPRHVDLIWAPKHDRLSGANVFTTLTSPHGLTARFAIARESPAPEIASLRKPFLGVILGGPSGGARYDPAAAADLIDKINLAKKNFGAVAVTPSRRTPADFLTAVAAALDDDGAFIWDRAGDNPYIDILGNAGALVVAADSHNMMSEAVATGTGVYVWRPPGLAKKLDLFVSELETLCAVRRLSPDAAPFSAAAIDSTTEIAGEIKRRMAEKRDFNPDA